MIEQPERQDRDFSDELGIPEQAETLSGYTYRPREDEWLVACETRSRKLHFRDIGLSDTLKNGFKTFLVIKFRTGNFNSAYAAYEHGRNLLIHISSYDADAIEINSSHIINYRSSLEPRQLYRSTHVNYVVRSWRRLGIPGISVEAHLTAGEFPKHRSDRGRVVRIRCPIQGAYSNLELDGLYKALHASFAQGQISLLNYALCLLSGALCPRPIQLASLWVGDLKTSSGPTGKIYTISIPRAKQSGGGYLTQFTERTLVTEIGMVIEAQAHAVRVQARRCGLEDPETAPLFPAIHVRGIFFENESTPARPTTNSISMRIINVMEKLGVRSERTGEYINVNATRARRTIGTRAAQAGKSLEEIASILDHSSLSAAPYYVEAGAEFLPRLDKKLAMLLAPMAQRFAGLVTRRGDDVALGIQRHVHGATDGGAGPKNIGGCGKHGFCGLGKPIACYTCRLFHPWLDGPHEEILESLLHRRREATALGSLIVASSLDDTIVACAEVVRLCSAQMAAS